METFGAFAARLAPIDATTERYVANALRVLTYSDRPTEQIDLFVSEAAKNVLLGYQLVEVADGMYRITDAGRKSIRRTDEQTLVVEGPRRWRSTLKVQGQVKTHPSGEWNEWAINDIVEFLEGSKW